LIELDQYFKTHLLQQEPYAAPRKSFGYNLSSKQQQYEQELIHKTLCNLPLYLTDFFKFYMYAPIDSEAIGNGQALSGN